MLNVGSQPTIRLFDHRVDEIRIDIGVIEHLKGVRILRLEIDIDHVGHELDGVVSIAKGFSFLIFCSRSLEGKSYQKVSLIGWRAKSRLERKVLPDIFVPRQIIGLLGWATARRSGGIH